MIKRKLTTNLMKKIETFRIMALGEAMKTPVLLIGVPGVAKTASVIDFAKASLGQLKGEDLFLLETDEGTKSNSIKGNIDLEELTVNKKFKINSPVTKAKVVVINEIDKASPSMRNSFLSIMNERVLFNGSEKIPCVWSNFIATCNEIPDDEKDSPFWDRFLITHEVKRLSANDMLNYYKKGGKDYKQVHNISLPEKSDIDSITLTDSKLVKIMDIAHSKLSDRTLSFLPKMIKNVMCVWGFNEDKGIIKTVELLIGKSEAKELAKTLVPKAVRDLYDAIDKIGTCVSNEDYNKAYDLLELAHASAISSGHVTTAGADGVLTKDDEEIKARISEQEAKLTFLDKADDVQDWD